MVGCMAIIQTKDTEANSVQTMSPITKIFTSLQSVALYPNRDPNAHPRNMAPITLPATGSRNGQPVAVTTYSTLTKNRTPNTKLTRKLIRNIYFRVLDIVNHEYLSTSIVVNRSVTRDSRPLLNAFAKLANAQISLIISN